MADKELVIKKLLVVVLLTAILVGCAPETNPPEATEVGYVAIEVYWTSFCSYCMEELVVLEELSQEIAGNPYLDGKVQITAANLDWTPQELQEFLQTTPYSFRMTTGEKLPRWSSGYPTIVIRDTYGKSVFQWIGFADKTQLYSMIMETLGLSAGNASERAR